MGISSSSGISHHGTSSTKPSVSTAPVSSDEHGLSSSLAGKPSASYGANSHDSSGSFNRDGIQTVHGIRHRNRSPISTVGSPRVNRENRGTGNSGSTHQISSSLDGLGIAEGSVTQRRGTERTAGPIAAPYQLSTSDKNH